MPSRRVELIAIVHCPSGLLVGSVPYPLLPAWRCLKTDSVGIKHEELSQKHIISPDSRAGASKHYGYVPRALNISAQVRAHPQHNSIAWTRSIWLPMQKPLDQFAIAARGQKNGQTSRLEEDSQVADHNLDIQARAIDLARHLINILKVNGSTAKHGQLSVFMGPGEADDGVSVALGRVAASTLTNLGLGVTFKTYEGLGHW